MKAWTQNIATASRLLNPGESIILRREQIRERRKLSSYDITFPKDDLRGEEPLERNGEFRDEHHRYICHVENSE